MGPSRIRGTWAHLMHVALNLTKNANSTQSIDVLRRTSRTAVAMATIKDMKQVACKSGTSCKINCFCGLPATLSVFKEKFQYSLHRCQYCYDPLHFLNSGRVHPVASVYDKTRQSRYLTRNYLYTVLIYIEEKGTSICNLLICSFIPYGFL
jgi:hypothetical protein